MGLFCLGLNHMSLTDISLDTTVVIPLITALSITVYHKALFRTTAFLLTVPYVSNGTVKHLFYTHIFPYLACMVLSDVKCVVTLLKCTINHNKLKFLMSLSVITGRAISSLNTNILLSDASAMLL